MVEINSLIIVLIESIVEVREGQNSDGFAENKSFSLLVEGEMQGTCIYNDCK